MKLVPFSEAEIPQIMDAMAGGRPWLPESSDYWFFRHFHGETSFVALVGDACAGGIVSCVDRRQPPGLYIDQVAVGASFRGKGIVQALFQAVESKGKALGCSMAWLSTDPRNPAIHVWPRLGYLNCAGDRTDGGLAIRSDFKGPGKDRALFSKQLGEG